MTPAQEDPKVANVVPSIQKESLSVPLLRSDDNAQEEHAQQAVIPSPVPKVNVPNSAEEYSYPPVLEADREIAIPPSVRRSNRVRTERTFNDPATGGNASQKP